MALGSVSLGENTQTINEKLIIAQTTDPGAGTALEDGKVLIVYE